MADPNKLKQTLDRAAELVALYPESLPVFARIDAEVAAAEARSSSDLVEQARALLKT